MFRHLVIGLIVIVNITSSCASRSRRVDKTNLSVDKNIQKSDIDEPADDMYNVCEVYDPYEKFNRVVYKFNSTVDYFLFRPIAICYDKMTNDYTKNRVGSFIENISTTPISTVNHALQFKFDNTMKSFWRFMLNTTLGVGGLFDVASKVGLPAERQGFGDTLGSYGVGPGPYIVLPLLGGTTARGVLDYIFTVENFMPSSIVPRRVNYCYSGGKLIHSRAKLLPFTDHVMEHSVDPYVSVRSSIHQNRESTVKYPKKFVCPIKK